MHRRKNQIQIQRPKDPKSKSEFDKELNASIFGFGLFEFGAVPVFLYFGYKKLTSAGAKLIYLIYFLVFLATWRETYWLSRIEDRARAATKQMWATKWVLPGGIETPVPLFIKEFIFGIPQYTDNMVLALAIGDVQRQWDHDLELWWWFTWRHVPMGDILMTIFSLPMVLFALMSISLVVHVFTWFAALVQRNNVVAAQIANLSVFVLLDTSYTENLKAQTKQLGSEEMGIVESLHKKVKRLCHLPVRLAERTMEEMLQLLKRLCRLCEKSSGEDAYLPMDGEEEVEEVMPTEEFQAAYLWIMRLRATRRRFFVKVVVGCSPRVWFKVSLEILLIKTRRPYSVMMMAIATSLLHVALGAEPYLTALWKNHPGKSQPQRRII